jgi:hypothetical protein
MVSIRSCRRVSSWCSPTRGTTSFPVHMHTHIRLLTKFHMVWSFTKLNWVGASVTVLAFCEKQVTLKSQLYIFNLSNYWSTQVTCRTHISVWVLASLDSYSSFYTILVNNFKPGSVVSRKEILLMRHLLPSSAAISLPLAIHSSLTWHIRYPAHSLLDNLIFKSKKPTNGDCDT